MPEKGYLLPCSTSVARTTVKQAISELGWQIKEESENMLSVSTPISLSSWGETIAIRISSQGNKTQILIASSPKLQLFDGGKSEENIDSLADKISELLQADTREK